MDAIVTAALGSAPQLVGGGVLFAILVVILRWHSQERADYRTDTTALTARHQAELARLNADHDAELAELRKDLAELRAQLDELNKKYDEERARRRAAEDAAGLRPGGLP